MLFNIESRSIRIKQLGKTVLANISMDKAELLLLKLIHLFARAVLLVKDLKIKETKTT